MAFVGLWPFVGAVQAGDTTQARSAASTSSSSVLWAGSSFQAGGFVGLFRFLGLPQASNFTLAQSALGIATTGLGSWAGETFSSGAANVHTSSGGLWDGLGVSYATEVALAGTSTLVWEIEVGAVATAFYITDDQTEMSPTGASIVNATFISSAAATVQWARAQVPSSTEFAIGTAALAALEASARSDALLAITAASLFDFSAVEVKETEVGSQAGTSLTFDSETIQPDGTFVIVASASLEFSSLPAVLEDRELSIDTYSLVAFDAQEIVPPITEFDIRAPGLLTWSSVGPSVPGAFDDDESEEDRRTIWAGAAEAERQLALFGVNDEDDLAVLRVALDSAYAQYRRGLQ